MVNVTVFELFRSGYLKQFSPCLGRRKREKSTKFLVLPSFGVSHPVVWLVGSAD